MGRVCGLCSVRLGPDGTTGFLQDLRRSLRVLRELPPDADPVREVAPRPAGPERRLATGPADAPPSTTIPPAEAGVAPIPAAPPAPVYANADDGVPLSLVVLAAVAGVIALIALLLALTSRTNWGERALAGPRRAWREAAFRAGGTWGDFADWIRVGR